MELKESEREAHAFAEMVRKMSHSIAAKAASGQNMKAAEMALALCGQATERKREIEERQSTNGTS